MRRMQRALSLIYPDQCLLCEARVDRSGGLCADCWRETPFLSGLVCDACGVALPGEDTAGVLCDDCIAISRPWDKGRAALSYRGAGRQVVLALKHGDRLDLVPSAALWMARAAAPILTANAVLVPIPAHWSRLLTRRYNQAAELSRGLARVTGLDHCPDALIRTRRTTKQDGMTVDQRFANLQGAIRLNPRRADQLDGRTVFLVDDVMTSGATLAVATEASLDAGADRVCTLVLARVEKAP